MCKIYPRVYRKDAQEDHAHYLSNGTITGGMLLKPSKDQSALHSHLYHWEEQTLETGPMHNEPSHDHTTELGDTHGTVPIRKDSAEENHQLRRIGTDYILMSDTGAALARHDSLKCAVQHYHRDATGDGWETQSVVVSKDKASSATEAHKVAAKYASGSPGAVDETSTSFRYRQKEPGGFSKFRNFSPEEGVTLVYGKTK